MKLIDADLLKQNCKCSGEFEDNFKCVDLFSLANVIDAQPTAYDVDKVVEQLEKESYQELCDSERIVNLKDAIEIVKAGGINE